MKNSLALVCLLVFGFSTPCFAQLIKIITATGLPANTPVTITDVEAMSDEDAKVFSYHYVNAGSERTVAVIVKIDNTGAVAFNKEYSLEDNELYNVELNYANGKIYALFVYRSSVGSNFYHTVIAEINKTTGALLTSAEEFSGYTSLDNHIAVDLNVNGFMESFLTYGYDNSPFLSKAYYVGRSISTPAYYRAYELSNPGEPDCFIIPSNMCWNHHNYNFGNNDQYFDFVSIYRSDYTDNSTSQGLYVYHQHDPTISEYFGRFTVNNNPMAKVNLGFVDGVAWIWGQNNKGLGDNGFFYGHLNYNSPTTINTYYNDYFTFLLGKKGFTPGGFWPSPISQYFFPICGYYKPDNNTQGYVNFIGIGDILDPGNIDLVHKYTMNIPALGSPLYYQGADIAADFVSGIAQRASSDPRKFYFWNDNDGDCSNEIIFSMVERDLDLTQDDNFELNIESLSITPITLDVDDGPTLSQSNVCSDEYDLRLGKSTPVTPGDFERLQPKLPLNIDNAKDAKSIIEREAAKTTGTKKPNVAEGLKVFPNPASESFIISSSKEMISSIRMYDAQGREVFRQENGGALQYKVSTGSLPAGIYMIKCQMASKNAVFKLIIK